MLNMKKKIVDDYYVTFPPKCVKWQFKRTKHEYVTKEIAPYANCVRWLFCLRLHFFLFFTFTRMQWMLQWASGFDSGVIAHVAVLSIHNIACIVALSTVCNWLAASAIQLSDCVTSSNRWKVHFFLYFELWCFFYVFMHICQCIRVKWWRLNNHLININEWIRRYKKKVWFDSGEWSLHWPIF